MNSKVPRHLTGARVGGADAEGESDARPARRPVSALEAHLPPRPSAARQGSLVIRPPRRLAPGAADRKGTRRKTTPAHHPSERRERQDGSEREARTSGAVRQRTTSKRNVAASGNENGKGNPRDFLGNGSREPHARQIVRGSPRRMKTCGTQPANTRVINRRSKVVPLAALEQRGSC